jgi:hypothetical protein
MRGIGEAPPEKGEVGNWSLIKLSGGQSLEAWLAGPWVGVWCHMSKKMKPCLHRYGLMKRDCPGCVGKVRIDWRAYQPVYATEMQIPTVAAFSRDAIAAVDRLELHAQVRIGRGPRDTDALYVAPVLKPRKFDTTLKARQVEQDICDWLPVMWRLSGVITGDIVRRGPVGNDSPPVSDPAPENDARTIAVRGEIGLHEIDQPPAISMKNRNEVFAKMHRNGTHTDQPHNGNGEK